MTRCSPENLICPELAAARNSWTARTAMDSENRNPTRPSRGTEHPASLWLRQGASQTLLSSLAHLSSRVSLDTCRTGPFCSLRTGAFSMDVARRSFFFLLSHGPHQPRTADKQDARVLLFLPTWRFYFLLSYFRRWWFRKTKMTFRHRSCSESTIINSAARLGCPFSHGWSNMPHSETTDDGAVLAM